VSAPCATACSQPSLPSQPRKSVSAGYQAANASRQRGTAPVSAPPVLTSRLTISPRISAPNVRTWISGSASRPAISSPRLTSEASSAPVATRRTIAK
jgi:hypothetical protein